MSDLTIRHGLRYMRWQATRLWAAMGPLELVALALLALWWGLQAQVVTPLEDGLAREREALVALQLQAARPAALPTAQGGTARHAFLAFLPEPGRREAQLLQLHALAQAQGLQWLGASYGTEPLPGLSASRLRVSLRMQGAYAAQRRFLHDMLRHLPNLAVDRLALEDDSGMVTAEVEASLLYRGEAAP